MSWNYQKDLDNTMIKHYKQPEHASLWQLCALALQRFGCCDYASEAKARVTVKPPVPTQPLLQPQQNAWFLQCGAETTQHPLKVNTRHVQHHRFDVNADRTLSTPYAVGVADGVSSVADEGYDPSRFPAECLAKCNALVLERKLHPEGFDEQSRHLIASRGLFYDPNDYVRHIVARAASATRELGSTTLCFAVLNNGRLNAVNIGDSGLLLFRLMAVSDRSSSVTALPHSNVKKKVDCPCSNAPLREGVRLECEHTQRHSCAASPLQHDAGAPLETSKSEHASARQYCLVGRTQSSCNSFNNPFQITRMPEPLPPAPEQLFEEVYLRCSSSSFALKDGDILIAASDGVLDNLYISQIADILNAVCLPSIPNYPFEGISHVPLVPPDAVAKKIVQAALMCAAQPNEESDAQSTTPFSDALYAVTGRRLYGGKPDDTTAVVAYIQAATSPASSDAVQKALHLRAALVEHPTTAFIEEISDAQNANQMSCCAAAFDHPPLATSDPCFSASPENQRTRHCASQPQLNVSGDGDTCQATYWSSQNQRSDQLPAIPFGEVCQETTGSNAISFNGVTQRIKRLPWSPSPDPRSTSTSAHRQCHPEQEEGFSSSSTSQRHDKKAADHFSRSVDCNTAAPTSHPPNTAAPTPHPPSAAAPTSHLPNAAAPTSHPPNAAALMYHSPNTAAVCYQNKRQPFYPRRLPVFRKREQADVATLRLWTHANWYQPVHGGRDKTLKKQTRGCCFVL